MANPKSYKALLIRVDARDAIDRAKQLYEEKLGIDVTYTQFVLIMCKEYEKLIQPTVRQ
jgi:hypothetical protein